MMALPVPKSTRSLPSNRSEMPPAWRSKRGEGPTSVQSRFALAQVAVNPLRGLIARQTPPPTAPQQASASAAAPATASTSSLTITQEPATGLQVQNLLNKWRARPTTPTAIKMVGTATVPCSAGGSSSGHEVGIHQVLTSEVNNARYRGQTSADGSLWIRRDIPIVRKAPPCPDSPFGRFWNASKPATCGKAIRVEYSDFPQDMYTTIETNDKTGKPNYLSELHLDFQFTTALMHKKPDATLRTLRWLRWGVGWDYTFDTPASGESKVRRGLASVSSMTFVDVPPTPAELPTRYAVPAKNCNTLSMEASDNPASHEANDTW